MQTVKTIRLAKNPASSPAVSPLGAQATAEPTLAATPLAAPAAKGSALTPFAICGICATVALLVIIGLQAFEISFFAASPSVWPVK